jgi:hypothetical protein
MKKEKKDLSELENAGKNANSLETDFRAEVLAAGFMEEGYDPDRIRIVRQGGAKRGFSKDIEDVEAHFSEYDLKDYLHIQTNRDSIYDSLPEGIFHQSARKKLNRDKEEILEEIKRHRMEEIYARKFFHVFEMESDHTLVMAYLYEKQYDKKISNSNYTDVFILYWPILKILKPEQRVLFMHIIPYLHRIRNSNDEIEKSMSALLEVPVRIEPVKLPAKNADSFFESKLGESRLGVDLVLGNTFDDGQHDIKVTVGPLSAKKMEYFLEPSVGNTILDFLCKLFLPGDAFVVKDFEVFPEDAAFILSDDNVNTYLGINTFI